MQAGRLSAIILLPPYRHPANMAQLPQPTSLQTTSISISNSFMQPGSTSPITPKLQLQLSIPVVQRDPDYYISDGNTVLLVENTLFKVGALLSHLV